MSLFQAIDKSVSKLAYIMHMISGATLVSMMFITLADVVTRSVFDLSKGDIDITFIGGVELIKYGLLIVVFFALPHSLGRSQVIVDLFTDTMRTVNKTRLEGLYILCYALLGGGMCFRFIQDIEEAHMTGETTQDLLIPLTYLYGIVAFATAVLAMTALLYALKLFVYGREELPR